MIRTVEAMIDEQGTVRLLESVQLPVTCRAIVLILDEQPAHSEETALLSEPALKDWNGPEEDEAWSHLQRAT